jgi:hypothetical protein
VLPEERVASAGHVRTWPLTTRPLGRKKLVPATTIHQLHDARGLERREGQEQEEGRDELRPHEEGESHEGEAPSRGAGSWS